MKETVEGAKERVEESVDAARARSCETMEKARKAVESAKDKAKVGQLRAPNFPRPYSDL